MNSNITFKSGITYAIDRIKQNPWFYVTAGITLCLIPVIAYGAIASIVSLCFVFIIQACGVDPFSALSVGQFIGSTIGAVIMMLILNPFLAAFFSAMNSEDKLNKAVPSDLFKIGKYIIGSNVAGFTSLLIITIGYILCIIPGLILTPVFYISSFFVSQGESPMAAISKSFTLLKNKPMLAIYSLLYWLIFYTAGLMLCCVGTLVTIPLAYAAIFCIFKQASGEETPRTLN